MGKVAFLGTGKMGGAMAARLLDAGHAVTVYNRSADKLAPLVDKGAQAARTPGEAATGADVVIAMVMNDDASRVVWCGPDGALSAARVPGGAVAVECSTVSHPWVMELGKQATAAGFNFLDCPVAGRPPVATAGQLAVFAGGDVAVLDKARPYLAAFSKSVARFGPIGSGIAFKLIYNLLGAIQVASLAEAMAACAAAGIDPAMAAAAFADGGTGSPQVKQHGPTMAGGVYPKPPAFSPEGRVKDLSYGIALIEQSGARSMLGETTRSLFLNMIQGGGANINDIELYEWLKRQAGKRRS